MNKYRFRISETNYVEFTQEDLDKFRDVDYIGEDVKGKIIPVTRSLDGKHYDIIAPLEMIELIENDDVLFINGHEVK